MGPAEEDRAQGRTKRSSITGSTWVQWVSQKPKDLKDRWPVRGRPMVLLAITGGMQILTMAAKGKASNLLLPTFGQLPATADFATYHRSTTEARPFQSPLHQESRPGSEIHLLFPPAEGNTWKCTYQRYLLDNSASSTIYLLFFKIDSTFPVTISTYTNAVLLSSAPGKKQSSQRPPKTSDWQIRCKTPAEAC